MANELEIIINKRSIRGIDTTTKEEYFSTFIDQIRWKRDENDIFYFFNSVPLINKGDNESLNKLGVTEVKCNEYTGKNYFTYDVTLNPDTGIVFVSADVMETWLGTNTGFYFDPNPIGVVVDITGVLTSVAHDATLTGDGTVGDPLSVVSGGGSGVFTPTINGTNMVEVSQESDFGVASLGIITLSPNTTYFIRGIVLCTNRLSIVNENIALKETLLLSVSSSSQRYGLTECCWLAPKIKRSPTTGGIVILGCEKSLSNDEFATKVIAPSICRLCSFLSFFNFGIFRYITAEI